MTEKRLPPVHPGDVLLEEFLKPLRLSQNKLGRNIGVPPRRINEIVLHKRRVTAETALRLARYFGTTPQFWLGLQSDHDLEVARDALGERLEREVEVGAFADLLELSAEATSRRGSATWTRDELHTRSASDEREVPAL